jgi:putative ATP-dependent endonuclease of the OLD family
VYEKLLRACEVPYVVIADRDYVEEIGTESVRKLFAVDTRAVKRDILSPRSVDGSTFVSTIDTALETGEWEHAKQVWSYIKHRRTQLRQPLDESEQAEFCSFVEARRLDGVHILKRGALEQYLPEGYRSKEKDLQKLISFLSNADFWDRLDDISKMELDTIANAVVELIAA